MKPHLRKKMKRTLAAMPPEVAAAKSRAACERLVALDEFARANVVMLYVPIPQEVDTVAVALAAWQDGKTVLVPKVNREQRHMIPVTCRSFDDDMVAGSFGIREPAGGEPWPLEDIDFIVVPALAYDRRGFRLGRGGGFYDRLLAEPGVHADTCGLGFAEQVVDELPTQAHDRRVDMLVTDAGVLRFG